MSKIRNLQAFVKAYLKSDSGKHALTRKDVRHKDKITKEFVYIKRDSRMAEAFYDSIA